MSLSRVEERYLGRVHTPDGAGSSPAPATSFYRYSWGPRFKVPGMAVLDRKDDRCRIIARGAMNSALVEFEDGARHVISRNALRKEDRP